MVSCLVKKTESHLYRSSLADGPLLVVGVATPIHCTAVIANVHWRQIALANCRRCRRCSDSSLLSLDVVSNWEQLDSEPVMGLILIKGYCRGK